MDSLLLKNQLCFPLYAASKEVVRLYKPYLSEIGLTYTQYITMMVLWEHRELTVKQIGEYLYLDSGTLTPLLKKLEKDGLALRVRAQDDERSVIIKLTSQGERLKDKARAIPGKVGGCMPLPPNEAAELYRLLYKVLGGISGCPGGE